MFEPPENLLAVASEFHRLGLGSFVFVGGATVGLYLTDPAAGAPRVTLDVDVVVDVGSRQGFYEIEERLRRAGHEPDPSGPVGRWRVRGVPVDLTPSSEQVLGFTNRWYGALVETAAPYQLSPGLSIRVGTPAMFLASKLEAFLDRGSDDPTMSSDLTDIVTLIDGRRQLPEEVASLPLQAREWVAQTIGSIVARSDHYFLIQAHLFPDEASQGRAEFVRDQMLLMTR